jgi:hypothetical protein
MGQNQEETNEISAVISPTGEAAFDTAEEQSDLDQTSEVKSMKKAKALRMPYWLKKTKQNVVRSLSKKEDLAASSAHDKNEPTTKVKRLFKVPKPLATSWPLRKEKTVDSCLGSRHSADLSATVTEQGPSADAPCDRGQKVARSQSLSENLLRPRAASLGSGSSASGSLGRRVATLGRLRGRQMVQSLKEWVPSLPASSIGQQADFENIRYKVGQSSFYLLSDGAETRAIGRLAHPQLPSYR